MRQKIALTKANLKRAERDQAKAADEKRQSTSTSDAGTDAGEDIDPWNPQKYWHWQKQQLKKQKLPH